ncbi:hypothetical protein N0V90_004023 [Kalmusia sp. IMI 367209]|nr:hypothetical protein N0V90_004023 [Kalmusia sp. IMI 367209]
MSFGFSPTDFITLINLTRRTYKGWSAACGEYGEISSTLFSFQVVLKRVHRHVEQPDDESAASFLQAPGTLREDLGTILRTSNKTIGELRTIVQKYPSLNTDRKSNWERIRLGCKNLDGLQIRLSRDLNLISTLLLDEVLQSIDLCRHDVSNISNTIKGGVPVALENMVENKAADSKSMSTAFTTYEHDSMEVWRELRREMISLGFKSDDVRANKDGLLAFARSISGDADDQSGQANIVARGLDKGLPPSKTMMSQGATLTGLDQPQPPSVLTPKQKTAPSVERKAVPLRQKLRKEQRRVPMNDLDPEINNNTQWAPINQSASQQSRVFQTPPAHQPKNHKESAEKRATSTEYLPRNNGGVGGSPFIQTGNPYVQRSTKDNVPSEHTGERYGRKTGRAEGPILPKNPECTVEQQSATKNVTQLCLSYTPISLKEQSPMLIHLNLPLGWQVHIAPKTWKVTFQDLFANEDEPMYLDLPPRVLSDITATPAGWAKQISEQGRLSWRTWDNGSVWKMPMGALESMETSSSTLRSRIGAKFWSGHGKWNGLIRAY